MKRTKLAWVALAVIGATSHAALAASSGNLMVKGTIKPPTCTVTVGGLADAEFAYGKISKTRLQEAAITPLEVKSLPLKIDCDGATKLAVSALDNKTGSNPFTTGTVDGSDAGEATNQSAADLFGLGTYIVGTGETAVTKKIGGFTLALRASSAKLDSVQAYTAVSLNNAATWATTVYGQLGGAAATKSWRTWTATSGSAVPAQGRIFEADLMVKPWIQPRKDLDLTDKVALDGSATLEVKYL